MAAETDFNKLMSNLKARQYAPVYYLFGEEHHFIDEVSNYIEANVLNDGEKGFNQMVLYGKDSDVRTHYHSSDL
jgi:DNA polymerase-3 subunit delta